MWPDNVRVAVNLSSHQFKTGTLALDVASALGTANLPAERLELEITETAILHNTEQTIDTLKRTARFRSKNCARRLRDRVLQPELLARLSVRQDQDRQVLHPGRGRRVPFGAYSESGGRTGREPRNGHHCRGRGDCRAIGSGSGGRVYRGSRVLLQRATGGSRDSRDAGRYPAKLVA